ncbi:D-alanyl-D-alanine carboxypeptidase family protein [Haloplasma contractile]|uniref:serine-type D-Ala-D-Ala carboxypeptidase n=1 Tax=Haloplasma contractile SSD-17B TaxID=1033810 RepID=F7Q1A6_9MOLU|nr:D-alanyl-D-alanine carboxypeptidase family protein [Haloplasma contractile]ERJ12824.1 D-alanyl-D-alanine carboxypeptidase DacF protein [Haloplasma contractile SSD-17B]
MKRIKIKKLFVYFLFLMVVNLLGVVSLNALAEEEQNNENNTTVDLAPNSKSAILIDLNTGKVLYEKNSHEQLYPASMTKIMSMHLILEEIEKGNMTWDEVITVSDHAASLGGSQIWLEPNEKMTVEDLFKSVAIASANDSVVALGERVAGSEEMFVKMMNERVKELGLKDTNFMNPHGLTDEDHYSSAYDMSMMARDLLKDHEETVTQYTSLYEDYIREDTDDKFWLVNTNKLVKYYEGIDGLKTGFTPEALYCLTATKRVGNMRLIAVVMGAETSQKRNADIVNLIKYGFSQYEVVDYVDKGVVMDQYENMMMKPNNVDVVTKEPISFLVKKGTEIKDLEQDIEYTIPKNGAKAGDTIGKITIYKDGDPYEVELTVTEDIEKAGIFQLFGRMFKNVIYGE